MTEADNQQPTPNGQPDEPELDESAYQVTLPSFTEQYTAYLDTMEELNLEVAADYIYMAALLIHIKSKMLLPRDEDEQPAEDPRQELVDRLLEYQRFKAVAESFSEIDVLRMGVWPRHTPPPGQDASEIDMSEVSLFDLIDAFRTALNRYKINHPQSIELHRIAHKVSDKMRELYDKVRERSTIRLQWFLEGRGRNELIAVFLATLELVRLGGISLAQGDNFGDIVITRTENVVDEAQFALFDER
jgi:segregation and condensation protein A